MPHIDLNLNPGDILPGVEASTPEPPGATTAEKIAAVGDFFSIVGSALEGKSAPPSALAALQRQKLEKEKLKREELIFEQQKFVSKMNTLGTFMDLRKSIPKSRQVDFDKNAISFIGDTDKRFGELYHFATENAGNTEIIGDLLGGGFEQDPVLQSQLANLGPNGFIDWTLGAGKTYIEQLKSRKFGPSAKAKIGAIVSDLKSNLSPNLFKKITKDGLTTVGEVDVINAHLLKVGNELALTDSELDFIKSDDGINTLQGMGIVSNALSEKLIETKRKKQIEAQFKDPKERFSRTGSSPVFDIEKDQQIGITIFDTKTNRNLVLLPSGEMRPRDPRTEVITRKAEIKASEVGTKKELQDFNSQEVSTRSFFDIQRALFEVLDKTPAALGNTAVAANFLTGVKTQVQAAANLVGADFDLSADPEDYSGIFRELGLVGAENAAVRSYLTSLAFAAVAAQGLGQKNIDSAKEMNRLLRQIGANAQSIPELKKAISAFSNTLRIKLSNSAEALELDLNIDDLVTPEEQDEIRQLEEEIKFLEQSLGE